MGNVSMGPLESFPLDKMMAQLEELIIIIIDFIYWLGHSAVMNKI